MRRGRAANAHRSAPEQLRVDRLVAVVVRADQRRGKLRKAILVAHVELLRGLKRRRIAQVEAQHDGVGRQRLKQPNRERRARELRGNYLYLCVAAAATTTTATAARRFDVQLHYALVRQRQRRREVQTAVVAMAVVAIRKRCRSRSRSNSSNVVCRCRSALVAAPDLAVADKASRQAALSDAVCEALVRCSLALSARRNTNRRQAARRATA